MLSLFTILTVCGLSLAGALKSNPPGTIDGVLSAALKDKPLHKGHQEFPDGSVLVEMDMRLNKDQYEAIHGNKGISNYKGLRDEKYRWTNNIIPYIIKDYFSAEDKLVIRGAMDEWEKYTCLTFVERTTQDDYIEIISGSGCWSMVGMNGRKQQLSLQIGSCVYHHTAVHELGHAIGYHHEQTRPDRDDYVNILLDNILSGLEYNFEKYDWNLIDDQNVTYDYLSVMHYSQYAFSSNGSITIQTKDERYDVVIGSVPGLSFKDIKAANRMYKCADRCTNECPAKAVVSKDCKCWCNTLNPAGPVKEWDGVSECKGGDDVTEPCIDYDTNCPQWAKEGECDDNAYWMSQNCMKSCKVCGPHEDRACRDFNSEWCPHWAMIGECQRNPGWMMINCRFSCKVCGEHPEFDECEDRWPMCEKAAKDGLCETNSEAMLTECPVSCKVCGDDVVCKNWDYRCSFWKADGQCTSEEKKMKLHCAQECGFCTGGTLPDCRDYANSRDCEWWADNGECSYNPGFMSRKCPLSCRVCGNGTVDAICIDNDVWCHEWGFDGQCETDKEYMELACRAECETCTPDPLDKPGCKNYDHNCQRWIDAGECDKNPSGMLYYCPRGCKACGPGTLCKDWHTECPSWKADGDCDLNKSYMDRHCPKSCDTCCTDPDGCDVIGGPDPGDCPPYSGTCYDYEDDCAEKAAAGECEADPDDMLRLCPISCKLCGDVVVAKDYKENCARWAFIGECVNNPGYMEMYCRKSCRCDEEVEEECEKVEPCTDTDWCTGKTEAMCFTDNDMAHRCPVTCKLCGDDMECRDFRDNCEIWSENDECTKNPGSMHRKCRMSCGCCLAPGGADGKTTTTTARPPRPQRECGDYEPCYDYEDDCASKAAAGECASKPGDMLRLCPVSCKLCGDSAECNDFNEDCAYWASYGECDNNKSYMEMYCRKSCQCCEQSSHANWLPKHGSDDTARSPVPQRECKDHEPCLDYWEDCDTKAAAGNCDSDTDNMLRFCPIACKLCGDNAECKDFNSNCAYWEGIGECDNNKSYMEMYCRKSCQCCEQSSRPKH